MTIVVIKKIENMFQTEKRPSGYPTYLVMCSECWKQFPMIKYDIWKTSYCQGCSNNIFKQSIKHWIVSLDKKFAECWYSILKRCNKESCRAYKNYWWRWIKCMWGNIDEFYNDMYESYLEHCKKYWFRETTIDRIDVNWNYCKENCRRATYKEQSLNRRNSKPRLFTIIE